MLRNLRLAMMCQQLIGEDYRLSMIDEATVVYHTQGEDFIKLLDYYINCQEGEEKYFFSSPTYMIMGEVKEDEDGRYWHVAYAGSRDTNSIDMFLKLAPFPLDRVHFCRYHKMNRDNPYKFYTWKNVQRLANYGIKT
mgnify:CR=1 FL=1